MSIVTDLKHLIIPFQDIEVATKKFTTLIGKGGYGLVYKGEVSLSGELTTVAVKRLDSNISGQGFKEFLTEIQLLYRFKHPNLISLLGFCEEGKEKVLIYEYAKNGSLDNYLRPAKTACPLTWRQRITICIDAARGLDYLHNGVAQNQRIIHRDIKSANILLDQNWKAMIADFGLSKIGRANENVTYLITNAAGTHGYCDPAYMKTGILTKESDVYSFGVVLFEILCGRLCFLNVNSEHRFLPQLAQRYYEDKKLNLIIDPDLKNHIDSNSVKEFSEVAYQCLLDNRKRRPSMRVVLDKLEKALELLELEEADLQTQELEQASGLQLQELVETMQRQIPELSMDYEVIKAIYKMPDTSLTYIAKEEIYSHLSTGILVDEDKVWFSIDDKGKSQELISTMKFIRVDGTTCRAISVPKSRFSTMVEILYPSYLDMKLLIRPQFLSSEVTYAVYLVFETKDEMYNKYSRRFVKYRLNNTSELYTSLSEQWEDNGWMMVELFQTIGFKQNAYFEVTLEGFDLLYGGEKDGVVVEGIQFLPIQKFYDDETETSEVDQNIPTSKIEWDNQLPSDYKQFIYYSNKEMMEMHQDDVTFPTKEDAYSILCTGVLIKEKSEATMIR